MGNCVWIVFGFLLDDGVNESGINTLALARSKDDPVEIAITRQGYVCWYLLRLVNGIYNGCKCGTKEKSGEIEDKEKRNYGKRRELGRAQMGRTSGKLHQ
jgi:hypothetical protein